MDQYSNAQRSSQEEMRRHMLGERRRSEAKAADGEQRRGFVIGNSVGQETKLNNRFNHPISSRISNSTTRRRDFGITNRKTLGKQNIKDEEAQKKYMLDDRRRLATNSSRSGEMAAAKSKINIAKRKVTAATNIAAESRVLLGTLANPLNMYELLGHVDILKDAPYILALIVGIFDDVVLDFSQIGDIPLIGGLLSWLCVIFMGFMYQLAMSAEGGNINRTQRQMLRRLGLMIISVVIEFIPIIAMIPSEIIIAFIIYGFLLAERQRRSERQRRAARGDSTEMDLAEDEQEREEFGNQKLDKVA